MAHFLLFSFHIVGGRSFRIDFDRYPLNDAKAGAFQGGELVGVIRDDLHLAKPQVEEDLGTLLVLASIDLKTELLIRFDSVGSRVLKGVSSYFVNNSDA